MSKSSSCYNYYCSANKNSFRHHFNSEEHCSIQQEKLKDDFFLFQYVQIEPVCCLVQRCSTLFEIHVHVCIVQVSRIAEGLQAFIYNMKLLADCRLYLQIMVNFCQFDTIILRKISFRLHIGFHNINISKRQRRA